MVWVKIENKWIQYRTTRCARKTLSDWCINHKGTFINFYHKKDSTTPFGSMGCYSEDSVFSEKYGVCWFDFNGIDDTIPDSGSSDGPYFLKENGDIQY